MVTVVSRFFVVTLYESLKTYEGQQKQNQNKSRDVLNCVVSRAFGQAGCMHAAAGGLQVWESGDTRMISGADVDIYFRKRLVFFFFPTSEQSQHSTQKKRRKGCVKIMFHRQEYYRSTIDRFYTTTNKQCWLPRSLTTGTTRPVLCTSIVLAEMTQPVGILQVVAKDGAYKASTLSIYKQFRQPSSSGR